MCFEVTSEAIRIEGYPLKPKTIQFLGKGIEATHKKNFELAKQYYELALQVQPDHPSLIYNLMTSKIMLDEEIDLQAELESLVSRFPTYSFASLSLALLKLTVLMPMNYSKKQIITKLSFYTAIFTALI